MYEIYQENKKFAILKAFFNKLVHFIIILFFFKTLNMILKITKTGDY